MVPSEFGRLPESGSDCEHLSPLVGRADAPNVPRGAQGRFCGWGGMTYYWGSHVAATLIPFQHPRRNSTMGGRERAIEALIDRDPQGSLYRANRVLVRCIIE